MNATIVSNNVETETNTVKEAIDNINENREM